MLVTVLLLPALSFSQEEAEPEVEDFYSTREQVTIGVMEFKGIGIPQDKADAIIDVITEHISKLGDVRVISMVDIISMFNLEKQKRLAGCTDNECFAEIAGSLGMPWVVTGSVSRLGRSYLLNLKLLDIDNIYVAGRVSRRIKGGEEDLLDELLGATQELFERVSDRLGLTVEKRVTIAARHPQPITESPSAVTVITREQIENTACVDVICLLRLLPEVDVRRIMPTYAAMGARALSGETGDKVLLLVDGMEINEEMFGFPHWDALPVHLEDIERIEVIRGPGSALYGANAHSAIVSIATRRPTMNKAEAFVGGGEQGSLGLHLNLDQRLAEHWRLNMSGGRETSGHWRVHGQGDKEINRVRLQVTRETESSISLLQAGLVGVVGQIYTKLGAIDMPEPNLLGHVLVSHRTDLFKGQVYFRTFDGDGMYDIPLYYQETQLGKLPRKLEMFSSNLDGEFQINWSPWENNLVVAGANYRWNTFICDQNNPDKIHQHRVGVFVQDEQRLFDTLMLTGGVRFDYNNVTPLAISPRLAAVWRFIPDNHLRLAFGTAFRKPSILNTSLHIKGVDEYVDGIGSFIEEGIGNDGLKNESIMTFELGYIGSFLEKRLSAEADVFYNRYRDTIAFHVEIEPGEPGLPDLEESKLEFRNQGADVDSVGGSVSLTYHMKSALRLNINYTLRHSWYVSTPSEHSAGAGEKKGARVPWEPAHLFNASFHYLPKSGIRVGMSVHYHSSFNEGWNEGGSPFGDPITIHNPAVFFVNGFAAWRWTDGDRVWETGLRVYNVFNSGFRDNPAVRQHSGTELGGQLIGRRIFVFMRGSI